MTTAIPHTRTARPGAALLDPPAARSTLASVALTGLRLAIGFQFLWAFFDKLLGLGYATPAERAWIEGGSPTSGFLSGATNGPLDGFFTSMVGVNAIDWLFMLGLLGVGAALLLGVALRPAAVSGVLLLGLLWLAVWPPARFADGQPTGSNNPLVDNHVVSAFALVLVAALAGSGAGWLGRSWNRTGLVEHQHWMR